MNTVSVVKLLLDGFSNKILLAEIMVELFKPDVSPKVRAVFILNLIEEKSRDHKEIAFAIAAGFVCDKNLTIAFADELSQGNLHLLTNRSRLNSRFDLGRFLGVFKGLTLLRDNSFWLLLSGEECVEIEDTLLPALCSFLFGTQGELKSSGGTEGLLSDIVTELVEKNPTFARVFLAHIWKKATTEVWSPLAVQVTDEFAYKTFGKLLSVSDRARAVSEFLAKRATA